MTDSNPSVAAVEGAALALAKSKGRDACIAELLYDTVVAGYVDVIRWLLAEPNTNLSRAELIDGIMGHACRIGSAESASVARVLFDEYGANPGGRARSGQCYWNASCRKPGSPVNCLIGERLGFAVGAAVAAE